jgi:O-antigen ligase
MQQDLALQFAPPFALEAAPAAAAGQRASGACKAGFVLFILVNAVLFIRPADLLPSLEGAPFYEILIVLAALASLPVLIDQLTQARLLARPLTCFVIALLPAIVLSQLSHGVVYEARMGAIMFAKIVLYFLLLVGLVDSPRRLNIFMFILGAFILFITVICILNWHGVIDLDALTPVPQWVNDDETGASGVILRMNGPGIFNDPNDLSLILATGIMLSIHFAFTRARWIARILILSAVAPFGYALSLTSSRGGLLAVMGGLVVYAMCRLKKKWAILLIAVMLPAMLFAFAGRQTDIDLSNNDDTFMGRVMLWRDSLVMFHQSPVFGIGIGNLAEENGLVAHNSYVHAFAELGLFGGTFFVGAVAVAVTGVWRLHKRRIELLDVGLRKWWPCMCAMLAAYFIGLYSLSRVYALPTYCILGVLCAYLSLADAEVPGIVSRLSGKLLFRTAIVSACTLIFLEGFVRAFAH